MAAKPIRIAAMLVAGLCLASLAGCGRPATPATPAVPTTTVAVPSVPAAVLSAASAAAASTGKSGLEPVSAQETGTAWLLVYAPVLPPGTSGIPYSVQVRVDKATGKAVIVGEAY